MSNYEASTHESSNLKASTYKASNHEKSTHQASTHKASNPEVSHQEEYVHPRCIYILKTINILFINNVFKKGRIEYRRKSLDMLNW